MVKVRFGVSGLGVRVKVRTLRVRELGLGLGVRVSIYKKARQRSVSSFFFLMADLC